VEEGFYFLSGELYLSDLETSKIPQDYVFLMHLFTWEQQCSSEGWDAFGNISEDDLLHIISAYKYAGLQDEALAISKAHATWQHCPDDEKAINKAYSSIPNEHSDDLDRIPYLINYFKNNRNLLHKDKQNETQPTY